MITHEKPNDTLKSISKKLEKLVFEEKETNVDDSFETLNNSKELVEASTETDETILHLEEKIKKYEEENKQLESKCTDLENCIDLLRNEYEKCEDYWATKLEEERQMFEQEQTQNTEKLNELINKMTEYEEQFAMQDTVDNRLPPIEEKYNLEKQFTDLEQEYEDYREKSEYQLEEKNREIEILKQKLTELALQKKETEEKAIQASCRSVETDSKMSNLSNHVVESTNFFSADAMPFNWGIEQNPSVEANKIQTQPSENQQDFHWNKENTQQNSSPPTSITVPWQNLNSAEQMSSTSSQSNSTPCRPKRTRKYDRNSILGHRTHRRDSQNRESTEKVGCVPVEPNCVLPLSVVHNMNGRLHHLEQRCRQLQVVLKQQHYYAEQMIQRKLFLFIVIPLDYRIMFNLFVVNFISGIFNHSAIFSVINRTIK